MRGTTGLRMLALTALLTVVGAAQAADVKILGTHNAKFNLTQTPLGAYRDHTPLELKNVPAGQHKLFAKSLVTGELIVFPFVVAPGDTGVQEFKATFRAPREDKNMQARRRAMVGGAAVVNETVGDGSTVGRVVVGGAAIANELIKGRNTDRKYSAEFGNTLEIKAQETVDVNLDDQGASPYEMKAPKVWHKLAPGPHKVFIRSHVTKELKLFRFEFPADGSTETVTIRPEFRPPQGETVNAKARRRTGILGALLANEVLNKGQAKSDVRLVALGLGGANELIGTKAGRHREPITLDVQNLPPDLPQDVEEDATQGDGTGSDLPAGQ